MKCIAIDDEPIALSIVENFATRKGGLQLELFNDPIKGLERIEESRPMLVFLDIEMQDISGLDIAKKLPKGTMVIFTTAHAAYAVDGFDADAIDFLCKPFSYDRFDKAVTKALAIGNAIERLRNSNTNDNKITIRVDYKNVTIPTNDILYIEAMDNYLKFFMRNGSVLISLMSMKSVLLQLPQEEFVRVHRSFIVSVSKIYTYSKKQLTLQQVKQPIPVGRNYADALYKVVEKS